MTPLPRKAPHGGAVVTEDCRRAIVSRGHDERGDYEILACQHKVRRWKAKNPDLTATERWCATCANRSPYR